MVGSGGRAGTAAAAHPEPPVPMGWIGGVRSERSARPTGARIATYDWRSIGAETIDEEAEIKGHGPFRPE